MKTKIQILSIALLLSVFLPNMIIAAPTTSSLIPSSTPSTMPDNTMHTKCFTSRFNLCRTCTRGSYLQECSSILLHGRSVVKQSSIADLRSSLNSSPWTDGASYLSLAKNLGAPLKSQLKCSAFLYHLLDDTVCYADISTPALETQAIALNANNEILTTGVFSAVKNRDGAWVLDWESAAPFRVFFNPDVTKATVVTMKQAREAFLKELSKVPCVRGVQNVKVVYNAATKSWRSEVKC